MMFSSTRRRSSSLALAFALATGTVLTAVAIEAPAQAQRKKKEKEPKQEFSDEFRALYTEMAELAQGDEAQKAQAVTKAPAFAAALSTPDDKYNGGILLFNLGAQTSNKPLQLQGIENILASEKAPADQAGSFYFSAYQLSDQLGDQTAARNYLMQMADRGLTFEAALTDGTQRVFQPDDIRMLGVETYWSDNDYAGGFTALDSMIAAKRAAGETVPETWYRRGLTVAEESGDQAKLAAYVGDYVRDYPSESSWKSAIAVAYNASQLDPQGMLDLLRLARRTNSLQNRAMYGEYIESADPRRLPKEVSDIINEGYGAGLVERSDSYFTESLAEATRRVESDRTELPSFLAEARQSNADLTTLMAAGDTFLSYGRAAEAEEFYNRALPMSGVDTARVLTRLGIAQLDQGKVAEAQATFQRVQGARQAMANLWAIYTEQQTGS